MSLTHDIVKAKLAGAGYLPSYPYHLISDAEMCDGFISISDDGEIQGYFADNYPNLFEENSDNDKAYKTLVQSILYHIHLLKVSVEDEYALPDWIYSYMLGSCVGVNSDTSDIHDLLVMLGCDNLDDIFDATASHRCLGVSESWVSKKDTHTVTVCPHCYCPINTDNAHSSACQGCGKTIDHTLTVHNRPPTMFGEPHVIKSLRLAQY